MDKNIDYSEMPANYTVCWHSNCPMADDCLRHLATEHLDEGKSEVPSVNLRAVKPESGRCHMQRPTKKVKYAYGMHRIYRNVRVCDKERLYTDIWAKLGNTMYYRYRNGKRPITPEVQELVATAFRKYGYTEPVEFDRVAEATAW